MRGFAKDDETACRVLHSLFHELWTLKLCSWFRAGNDPRAQKIAAAARLNELRENELNPPDLVRREPEVVQGYPDRILAQDDAAAALKKIGPHTVVHCDR